MMDSRLPIPDSRLWTPEFGIPTLDSRLLKEQKYYGNRNFRKYPSL